MLAVYLASALLFFVLSRYRMPSVPVLLIFASFAAVSLYDAVRARRYRFCLWGLAALVALFAIVHLDLTRENLYMAHFNLGNKYRDLGQWDRAVQSYGESLRINPGFVDTHVGLALAHEGAGRSEEAARHWRLVLAWSLERRDGGRAELARSHLREPEAEPQRSGPE